MLDAPIAYTDFSSCKNSLRRHRSKKLTVDRNMTQAGGKIYTIASGKGGVGKTSLTASIGVALAATGNKVVLVDADLSGPNLHTFFGISQPKHTLYDFYMNERPSLVDLVLRTPYKNLYLISGAIGTLGIANQKYFQKQRLIRQMRKLPAAYIILDIGSGASYNEIDLSLVGDEQIVISTPEPTSILEAFSFVKVSLLRNLVRALRNHPEALEVISRIGFNRPDGQLKTTANGLLVNIGRIDAEAGWIFRSILNTYRPRLLANMIRRRGDVQEVLSIRTAAKTLLSLNVGYVGHIPTDPAIRNAIDVYQPFFAVDPKSKASQAVSRLVQEHMLNTNHSLRSQGKRSWWHLSFS